MNKLIKNTLLPLLVGFAALFAFKTVLEQWYLATENENFRVLREKSRLNCEALPLHCAVRDDDGKSLQALLDKEVDLELKDNWGNTALLWAVKHGKYAQAEKLLAVGARADTRDASGESLFFYVLQSGKFGLAEKLLKSGANINALSEGEYPATVLHYCVMKNRTECVRFLLLHGAKKNIKDSFGYTVMKRLEVHPHINIEIRWMLEKEQNNP